MQHSYHIFRTWIWELLAVALSIGLLTAISALLISYDGKPTPDWGARLNFNALLALLSTMLRAMLVVVVSQIICQQKWEWYGNLRPLRDFQQFESGSRGISGALLLLPTVAIKDTVTFVAALVLIVSFLVGPFVQQASRTTTCTFWDPSETASVPYAHYVPRRGGVAPMIPGGEPGRPAPDTVVAILSSVTAPDGVENRMSGICSTGNCTFRDENPAATEPQYVMDDDYTTHSTVAMCDTCVDIAALVSIKNNVSLGSTSLGVRLYTLPNHFNVSYSSSGSDTAIIRPAKDLAWMGDLLTPELKAKSRWAYVNATFLSVGSNSSTAIAAICILYPCLRTYNASITKNQLHEKELFSEPMQVDLSDSRGVDISDLNTINNPWYHYTAVKSPCKINGEMYAATSFNTSLAVNTTTLNLADFTDYGRSTFHKVTWRNFTAPESCIYRHNNEFGMAISAVLTQEIFDGECTSYKGLSCYKSSQLGNGFPQVLSNLGAKTVLTKLIDGEVAYSNVSIWFNSFANAMTNRFRSEYGSEVFNVTDQDLPVGEVKGLAWRTETCISAHRDWLALPISLTAVTTLLMIWTIAANWRHRRTRPVWKDNLLPLIYYGYKIEPKDLSALPNQIRQTNEYADGADTEEQEILLEASEMSKISAKTPVTFRWPQKSQLDDEGGNTFTIAFTDRKYWFRQRKSQEIDVDSLLETTDALEHGSSDVEER